MASTLSPSIPQEILDSLAAIKAVFASAKGPRVVQLQQDVAQIENYILSQEKTPVLDNHQQAVSDLEYKIIPKTAPLIAFLKEINQRVNLGIDNCEDTLEQLIVLQNNNAIALQKLNLLKEEYQEAEQLINLIKKVKESLDILSVNTAIQATQQDSEEELVSIAEQVEIIASQAKETVADIEDWIIELQDTTNILDQSLKPTQIDLDTVVQNVEKMRQQLQEVVETTN